VALFICFFVYVCETSSIEGGEVKLFFLHHLHHHACLITSWKFFVFFINRRKKALFWLSDFGIGVVLGSVGFQFSDSS